MYRFVFILLGGRAYRAAAFEEIGSGTVVWRMTVEGRRVLGRVYRSAWVWFWMWVGVRLGDGGVQGPVNREMGCFPGAWVGGGLNVGL